MSRGSQRVSELTYIWYVFETLLRFNELVNNIDDDDNEDNEDGGDDDDDDDGDDADDDDDALLCHQWAIST